jgi:sugar (pentulose or hexulose) kinase
MSLSALDKVGSRAVPGAEGYFLGLPIWDEVGQTEGDFRFVRPESMIGRPSMEQRCRAVLESIAYAAHGCNHLPATASTIHVSGGGATSSPWLNVLATALDRVLSVSPARGTALGSCMLASQLTGTGGLITSGGAAVPPGDSEKAAETRLVAVAWYSHR